LQITHPLLPESKRAEYLRSWDLRIERDAYGATVFERVYHNLLVLVFGEKSIDREAMQELITNSSIFTMIHVNFDHILLVESSPIGPDWEPCHHSTSPDIFCCWKNHNLRIVRPLHLRLF